MARERNIDLPRREYAPPVVEDRVAVAPPVVTRSTDIEAPRDRLRWGPIWGGLLAALATFLVLELLMYGFGWLTLDFTGRDATRVGAAWVSALLALIAFFVGGWVAQATSSVRGADAGALHGFMVWALSIAAILLFSGLGLGLAFGPVGTVLNQFSLVGAGNARLAGAPGAFRDTALWSVLFLIVAAAAAAGGGVLGDKKPDDPVGHLATDEG